MEYYPGQKLSEVSAVDKPWDRHKGENERVGGLYGETLAYQNLQNRMNNCAPWLLFGEISADVVSAHDRRIKLEKARFCRVRLCPVCMWRKSLALKARFLRNWEEGYKEVCGGFVYIHIVFTVENPVMSELRNTIQGMNGAFKKLLKRKEVLPVCKGYIKSVEVTRGQDGNPHPHFHVTMAVNPSYFTSRDYIAQPLWVQLWRDCLGIDYDPIVSVKRVRDRRKNRKGEEDDLAAALIETVKYSVKSSDLFGFSDSGKSQHQKDREFLYGLTEQIKRLRFLDSGGCFKGIFKNHDRDEDEISENELMLKRKAGDETTGFLLTFSWDGKKEYVLKGAEGRNE